MAESGLKHLRLLLAENISKVFEFNENLNYWLIYGTPELVTVVEDDENFVKSAKSSGCSTFLILNHLNILHFINEHFVNLIYMKVHTYIKYEKIKKNYLDQSFMYFQTINPINI